MDILLPRLLASYFPLALALGCSEGTINRYIRQNDDNLTKAVALDVIRRETGLKEEELLERK